MDVRHRYIFDMKQFFHYFFERLEEWRESTCAVLLLLLLCLSVTAMQDRQLLCSELARL